MAKDTATITVHPVESKDAKLKRAIRTGGGDSSSKLRMWFEMAGKRPGWKILTLHHMRADKGPGDMLVQVNMPDADIDTIMIESFVDRIVRYAKLDAESVALPQQYVVYPRDAEGDIMPGRCIFREGGAHSLDISEPLDSEGPNLAGITTQLMRHNEVNFKASSMVMMANNKMLQEQNIELRQRISELEQGYLANIKARESMLSKQHERELATQQATAKIENWREVAGVAKMLLPVVVNKIAGKKMLPEQMSGRDVAVKALMESLMRDEARRDKIFTLLKPAEMGALASLLQSFPEVAAEAEAEENKDEQEA